MTSPDELMVKVVTGTVSDTAAKALDSDVLKGLLGPLANEVGSSLGSLGSVFRFYTEQNLSRIFTRWERARKSAPLNAESFQRVIPLLQPASMESREELHEQWANLLESAATSEDNHVSFATCLSQLNVYTAKYLDHLWSVSKSGMQLFPKSSLETIYLDRMRQGEAGTGAANASAVPFMTSENVKSFESSLSDLSRLSLLEKSVQPRDTRGQTHQVTMRVAGVLVGQQTIEVLGFSDYGKRFMEAVGVTRTNGVKP